LEHLAVELEYRRRLDPAQFLREPPFSPTTRSRTGRRDPGKMADSS